MKKRNFLFDPKEHGGEGNMYIFWFSVAAGIIGFVVKTVIDCFCYE